VTTPCDNRARAARPVYQLTLEALPCDVPPATRLKRGLKYLLRALQLKCTSVAELPAPSPTAAQAASGLTGPANESPVARGHASTRANEGRDRP
jgi:hypothetical protein